MLKLMGNGTCMNGVDAVEFFENLAAGEDITDDAKTPKFCSKYGQALNRLRYEVRKSIPIPPKVVKAVCHGQPNRYSCGICGFDISRSDLSAFKYCPNCGCAIAPPEGSEET